MSEIVFKVKTGLNEKQIFKFDQEVINIGRDRRNDIVLNDRAVSKHHATITYQNGNFVIQDYSSNGTFINELRVKTAILKIDDLITVGRSKFQICSSLEKETVLLEPKTRIQDRIQVINEKSDGKKKDQSKKVRPAVWLFAGLILLFAILLIVIRPKCEKPEAGIDKTYVCKYKPPIDINYAWSRLNILNISDKQLKQNLQYAKVDCYDKREWNPGKHYEAIKIWGGVKPNLDLRRENLLDSIVDASQCELQNRIDKSWERFVMYRNNEKNADAAYQLKYITEIIPNEHSPDYRRAKDSLDVKYGRYLKNER